MGLMMDIILGIIVLSILSSNFIIEYGKHANIKMNNAKVENMFNQMEIIKSATEKYCSGGGTITGLDAGGDTKINNLIKLELSSGGVANFTNDNGFNTIYTMEFPSTNIVKLKTTLNTDGALKYFNNNYMGLKFGSRPVCNTTTKECEQIIILSTPCVP